MKPAVVAAMLAAAPALAGPVYDPISAPIPVDARVGLRDFLTVPPSAAGLYFAPAQNIQPMGDRHGRLAINDTRGIIWTTTPAAAEPVKFLDVRAHVAFDNSFNPGESGLHGLAFHPNFAGDPKRPGYGKFYTGVSVKPDRPADFLDGDNLNDSIIVEWSTDPRRATYAETAPPRELLRIGDYAPSHNVGSLVFNPRARRGDADYGQLYVGYGDGGGPNDTRDYAANIDVPLGKILRINPLDPDGEGPLRYGVPADNPYVGRPGLDEVYASGFRHPQHLSFDRVTGALYATDFGEANLEEVNLVVAGGDYGWQRREGTFRTAHDVLGPAGKAISTVYTLDGQDDGFVYPVAQFDHSEGVGISSAHVYRGRAVPELYGKLVFSEIQGRLYYVDLDEVALGRQATVRAFAVVYDGVDMSLRDVPGAGYNRRADLRLGFDQFGELYAVTKPYGRVFKFVTLQTPEPGLAALFGLAALGLLARRRLAR